MPEIIGKAKYVSSHMEPLQAHLSHLRHIAKPQTAQLILHRRFGFGRVQAKEVAKLVSAHVEQAVEFHCASLHAMPRVRPLLQYYTYLNLACAFRKFLPH